MTNNNNHRAHAQLAFDSAKSAHFKTRAFYSLLESCGDDLDAIFETLLLIKKQELPAQSALYHAVNQSFSIFQYLAFLSEDFVATLGGFMRKWPLSGCALAYQSRIRQSAFGKPMQPRPLSSLPTGVPYRFSDIEKIQDMQNKFESRALFLAPDVRTYLTDCLVRAKQACVANPGESAFAGLKRHGAHEHFRNYSSVPLWECLDNSNRQLISLEQREAFENRYEAFKAKVDWGQCVERAVINLKEYLFSTTPKRQSLPFNYINAEQVGTLFKERGGRAATKICLEFLATTPPSSPSTYALLQNADTNDYRPRMIREFAWQLVSKIGLQQTQISDYIRLLQEVEIREDRRLALFEDLMIATQTMMRLQVKLPSPIREDLKSWKAKRTSGVQVSTRAELRSRVTPYKIY